MRSCVNRNLIHAGKPRYDALVESGYSPSEIQAAWDRVQLRAKREKRGPRYYPQLKRWLESLSDDGAQAALERSRAEKAAGCAPEGAPKTLPALAARDEAFARVYWTFCDARQRANQRGCDPESDPECRRLKDAMLRERDAAYGRLAPQLE